MEDLIKRLAKELTPVFPQRIRQYEVDCVICDMTSDVEEMKITDEVEAEQYLREEFSKDDKHWLRPFNQRIRGSTSSTGIYLKKDSSAISRCFTKTFLCMTQVSHSSG